MEASVAFYERFLPFLGLQRVFSGNEMHYWVGGRTALAIQASRHASESGERFRQDRVGLHHLCFRARSRQDVDMVYQCLVDLNAAIVHPPEEGTWAPGYYSVLFEDPDGIRLEVNYVPGEGLLAPGRQFNPGNDYQ